MDSLPFDYVMAILHEKWHILYFFSKIADFLSPILFCVFFIIKAIIQTGLKGVLI